MALKKEAKTYLNDLREGLETFYSKTCIREELVIYHSKLGVANQCPHQLDSDSLLFYSCLLVQSSSRPGSVLSPPTNPSTEYDIISGCIRELQAE